MQNSNYCWDPVEAAWQRAYADLLAFKDEHGHFEIPKNHRTSDGTGLAQWAHHQRQALREGTITGSRKALLDKVGFPWDAAEARWMRRCRQLSQAIAAHGGPRNLPPGSPRPPPPASRPGPMLSARPPPACSPGS
jgi:Helicase associated domain